MTPITSPSEMRNSMAIELNNYAVWELRQGNYQTAYEALNYAVAAMAGVAVRNSSSNSTSSRRHHRRRRGRDPHDDHDGNDDGPAVLGPDSPLYRNRNRMSNRRRQPPQRRVRRQRRRRQPQDSSSESSVWQQDQHHQLDMNGGSDNVAASPGQRNGGGVDDCDIVGEGTDLLTAYQYGWVDCTSVVQKQLSDDARIHHGYTPFLCMKMLYIWVPDRQHNDDEDDVPTDGHRPSTRDDHREVIVKRPTTPPPMGRNNHHRPHHPNGVSTTMSSSSSSSSTTPTYTPLLPSPSAKSDRRKDGSNHSNSSSSSRSIPDMASRSVMEVVPNERKRKLPPKREEDDGYDGESEAYDEVYDDDDDDDEDKENDDEYDAESAHTHHTHHTTINNSNTAAAEDDGTVDIDSLCPCGVTWVLWYNLGVLCALLGRNVNKKGHTLLVRSLHLLEQALRHVPTGGPMWSRHWSTLRLSILNNQACILSDLCGAQHHVVLDRLVEMGLTLTTAGPTLDRKDRDRFHWTVQMLMEDKYAAAA